MKFSFVFVCVALPFAAMFGSACSKPTTLKIEPEKVVLDGANDSETLAAKVFDQNGKPITEGNRIVWFSDDTKIIKLSADGVVSAVASGEAEVEAEVVGAELKAKVPIRVKIAASVVASHERMSLWIGQVKEDVWAEVHSEKEAFIEGYLPQWESEDPSIVKAEAIVDPRRRQSWVKLTALKEGVTFLHARFNGLDSSIRVSVYDENRQYAPDGTPLDADGKPIVVQNPSKDEE
jgi:hypothetical protein